MIHTAQKILWLFLIYSFLGWVGETTLAAAKKKHLLNRGFLNAPFSPIYGFGWLLFAIFMPALKGKPFFLFLGCTILAMGLEYFTGKILQHFTGHKWWDYSDSRFQFDGLICLPYSILWGLCGMACLYFTDNFFLGLIHFIPSIVSNIALLVIYVLLGLDLLVSCAAALNFKLDIKLASEASRRLKKLSGILDNALTRAVQRRMKKAYPTLNKEEKADSTVTAIGEKKFAQGICFYKIFILFMIAAFLGDIIETIFCRFTAGRWMSRSSVVFGPFSIVWGLGAVILTLILYRHRNRSDSYVFVLGTVLGGAYEWFCSVFTELVFGTVFWDYSHLPFNLGGRINLLFCFFWGIVSVVWLKFLYPKLSDLIERIPITFGRVLTWSLLVFMIFNVAVSALALNRFNQRQTMENPPESAIGEMMDEYFPDERIWRVYPNLKFADDLKK